MSELKILRFIGYTEAVNISKSVDFIFLAQWPEDAIRPIRQKLCLF